MAPSYEASCPESYIPMYAHWGMHSNLRPERCSFTPGPSIRPHRGLRQGSGESTVLYLILLEPRLRSLARKAKGDTRHIVPALGTGLL